MSGSICELHDESTLRASVAFGNRLDCSVRAIASKADTRGLRERGMLDVTEMAALLGTSMRTIYIYLSWAGWIWFGIFGTYLFMKIRAKRKNEAKHPNEQ